MEPFRIVTGLVAPLDRANVDTDAIIPKQFLKSIKRSGFGPNLFDAWRYQDRAVLAIEERDGVSYYVERTSPVRPIQLVRMPGFRRELQSLNGTNVGQP